MRLDHNVLTKEDLLHGEFGVEREGLRIDESGQLSEKPHPVVFGDRTKNPYITTDFAEAQVEMITPVATTLEETYNKLRLIYDVVVRSMDGEYLWPYSMPMKVEQPDECVMAVFPDTESGRRARTYREYLQKKYGNGPQLISGIHYNFSFSKDMIAKLHASCPKFEGSFQDFKNELYLKLARQYLNYHWFLVYMLGASPQCLNIDEASAISLRNSKYGYQNFEDLGLCYDSVESHVASIRRSMEAGIIIDEREIYSPVRLKTPGKGNMLDHLVANGITYLELRSVDLNPFDIAGISLSDLKFIHLFTLTLVHMEEKKPLCDPREFGQTVALNGRDHLDKLAALSAEVLDEMKNVNDLFDLGAGDVLTGRQPLYEQTLGTDFLQLAKDYKKVALEKPYQSYGYEEMEMSTQLMIAESIRRGVKIELWDRKAHFLRLEANGKVELVKQATKTSLDSYVSFLAMENKEVTKKVLEEAGFNVPAGKTFTSVEAGLNYFNQIKDTSVVVKPKSTNFGWGIMIFNPLTCKDAYEEALKIAFGFDDEVIVEKFLHGQEYRFLVVGDEVVGVLKRVGANVIGDGTHTIIELIDLKNEHPFRGVDHQAPLEKIQLGEIELQNLKQSGYRPDDVLPTGVQVFLRDNSNISTGGDSIDVTNETAGFFKEQAVLAAKAIGARVCGVDLIINGPLNDPNSEYGFIELNFNPAIHMHAFVLEGEGRNAAPYVLAELGLIDEV